MAIILKCPNCASLIPPQTGAERERITCRQCGASFARQDARPAGDPADSGARRFGPYVVTDHLGSGRQGEVWLAYDPNLDRAVAVKIFQGTVSLDKARLHAIVQNARAAARLNHPHVAPVYRAGLEGERVYIAMQFVDGGTLEQAVRRGGPLGWREATAVIRDAASGLCAGHRLGLTHGSVKPAHLMRTAKGVVKLVDFGLGPAAAGPEAAGRDLRALVDVYRYLLTGIATADSGPPPAKSLRENLDGLPDLPPGLEAILTRGLGAEPGYRTAEELIADLDALAGPAGGRSAGRRGVGRLAAWARRGGRWAIAAAAGALLVGGVLYVSLRGRSPRPVEPSTASAAGGTSADGPRLDTPIPAGAGSPALSPTDSAAAVQPGPAEPPGESAPPAPEPAMPAPEPVVPAAITQSGPPSPGVTAPTPPTSPASPTPPAAQPMPVAEAPSAGEQEADAKTSKSPASASLKGVAYASFPKDLQEVLDARLKELKVGGGRCLAGRLVLSDGRKITTGKDILLCLTSGASQASAGLSNSGQAAWGYALTLYPDGWFIQQQVWQAPPEGWSSVQLRARAFGYEAQDLAAKLAAGRITYTSLALTKTPANRCRSVAGRVVDESGKPLAGTVVRLDFPIRLSSPLPTTVRQEAQTDEHGEYRFSGLSLAEHQLTLVIGDSRRGSSYMPGGSQSDDLVRSVPAGTNGAVRIDLTVYQPREAIIDYVAQTTPVAQAGPQSGQILWTPGSQPIIQKGGYPLQGFGLQLWRDNGDLFFTPDLTTSLSCQLGHFYDVGPVNLEAVTRIDTKQPLPRRCPCLQGHVYVAVTKGGLATKLLVREIRKVDAQTK